MDREAAKKIAEDNGYIYLKFFGDGTEAAIMRLMFTHAIIHELSEYGYGNRWCYKTYDAAKSALEAWDGTGEPDGWHRHPGTCRRRENGVETINF
jgi:hypothetical protein